jgi:ferrous iron transport protein B
MVLWWMSSYPHSASPAEAVALQTQAAEIAEAQPTESVALREQAETIIARSAVANSFVGRIGRTIEPVLEPIGADWQLSIGILTSFAAREVFVSTLAVIFTGNDDAEDASVIERVRTAQRDDGSPVFTLPAAAGLLVFYVLAMQCLPTLAVTAREAGGWKWALLQLVYMSVLAYVLGAITFNAMRWAGIN